MTHTTEEIKKALELVKEYESLPLGDEKLKRIKPDLKGWLQEKLEPKATLFEKWKGFCDEWLNGFDKDERLTLFEAMKEHFKEELSGTRGLREAIEWISSKHLFTIDQKTEQFEIKNKLKAILKRMEGEG